MNTADRKKLFQDVFAPRPGEEVLFVIDVPHDDIIDTKIWHNRRIMAKNWFITFQEMGKEIGFSVHWLDFMATGLHNSPLPKRVVDKIRSSDVVVAMTQYSASSSLLSLLKYKNNITRGASMALVEERMEETALRANYREVQQYAQVLQQMLDTAIGAKIVFSTGEELYIDLRYRDAYLEAGECRKKGQFINLPSGEACIAPYEAVHDEINQYGRSKTRGVWPVILDDEKLQFIVKENRITKVIGVGGKTVEMQQFFAENPSRTNIAELGIGCNPFAVVTGNPLEDEKAGLHIAYGMSTHLGGKVKCDTHYDFIYAKGCPIEGRGVTLIYDDRSEIELINNGQLRYELLKS